MKFEEMNSRLKKAEKVDEDILKGYQFQEVDSINSVLIDFFRLCFQCGIVPIECLNLSYRTISNSKETTCYVSFINLDFLI